MKNILGLGLFALLIQFGARADEAKLDKKEHRSECMKAAKSLCGSVKKGDGAKIKCLEENISKLPEKCQEGASKRLQKSKERQAKREKCQSEAQALCGSMKDDKKAFRQCLKENKDKISQECKDLRGQRKERRNSRK